LDTLRAEPVANFVAKGGKVEDTVAEMPLQRPHGEY